MTDKSLREALEALASDYATIDAEQITDLRIIQQGGEQ